MAKDAKTWEFGDFQTPLPLAKITVARLRDALSFTPKTIIEPTCGVGAFLIAAAEAFPETERIIGVEIEATYLAQLHERIEGTAYADKVTLIQGDFFKVDWAELLAHLPKPILFIGKPPFSIFGIGDYAFEPWKVAISGFYKRLGFQLIPPHDDRPVMVDDTVYFIGCSSEAEARFLHEILTSDLAKGALSAMVFWNDKRPITVDLLKRLNLAALAAALGRDGEYSAFAGGQNGPAHQQLAFAIA